MIVLNDFSTVRKIDDFDLLDLIQRRSSEIANGEPFDPDIHGCLIVVEPGDTAVELENVSGCMVLTDQFSGNRFGYPGFTPNFEYLEEHPCCYEMVFVPGDGDFGIVIFIPKGDGIDADLLTLCAAYATPQLP